jgi:poly-gamma-glutamate synthesis protein (capsule biosynthesis protein)
MKNPLIALSAALLCSSAQAGEPPVTSTDLASAQLVFTGDVMLSRLTQQEITRTGENPWAELGGFLRQRPVVIGNLEGSIGDPAQCNARAAEKDLCFAVPEKSLDLARQAGFTALGTANNHSGDLREAGRRQTEKALSEHDLLQLDLAHSPAFFSVAGKTVAVVALNRIPARDGQQDHVNDVEVRQKLQVAHALANWTVVFLHWGNEMTDWATPLQYEETRELHRLGADVVIGAHPHVVQPPECVDGTPVFFSLGNHLFDQKYAQTKQGMLATCSIQGDTLSCQGLYTHTQPNSYAPTLEKERPPVALGCPVKAHDTFHLGNATLTGGPSKTGDAGAVRLNVTTNVATSQTDAVKLSGVWPLGPDSNAGEPLVLLLESHYSDLDQKIALRPYVYGLTHGKLRARWRGTALAYPLTDVAVPPNNPGLLCGLHTKGGFLVPNAAAAQDLTLGYRWNGFGFSLSHVEADQSACHGAFSSPPES